MQQLMTRLKLARVRDVYEAWLERAAQDSLSYRDFLEGLLHEEILAREENQTRRRLKGAAFPFEKTIEQFDFTYRPELKKQVIVRYLEDSFITAGESVVFIGPAGLGKTHLLSAIGNRVLQRHRSMIVQLVTLDAFVEELHAAVGRGDTDAFKQRYLRVGALLVDDMQFLTGHRETQAELLRIFTALQADGRQVVMTSDRAGGDRRR